MRFALFGGGDRATTSLLSLVREGNPPVCVVPATDGSGAALEAAATAQEIPIISSQNVNNSTFLAKLKKFDVDYNISISFNQLIRPQLIEMAPHGFVNFHPGKLPNYRGRSTINWAIINGESEIGITAHYIDEGIDTGDIILQQTLPIAWTDHYADVSQRIDAALPGLVMETMKLIEEGRVCRKPQSADHGTYYCRREDGDEWLEWSDTSLNIYNKIRGISGPGPGAQTIVDDQLVVIWRACLEKNWPSYSATHGQIVKRIPGEGVLIKTGDSTLLVQCVQFADEDKRVPDWRVGTRLGLDVPTYLLGLRADLDSLLLQFNARLNTGRGSDPD